jgi:FkbM family methyltransferase
MCANKNLERNRIEVVHKAVTDRTGSLTFHVLEAREGAEHAWRKGSSSLHQRQDGLATKPVEVPAIRLDEFVANLQPSPSGIALWVDVEGAAYETLDGMQAVADRVHIVSAEVETKECWPGQKLASDVHALLKGLGFRYVGRGLGYREVQYDVLYVNERMYSRHPFGIRWLLLQTILLTGIKHTCGSLYAVLKRCCGDR